MRFIIHALIAFMVLVSSVSAQTLGSGTLGSVGGTTSPLTTKGDLYTYSTLNARLPVGTNGLVLSADSTEATGLKWVAAGSGTITGSGTSGVVTKFTGASSIGDSLLTTTSTNLNFTSASDATFNLIVGGTGAASLAFTDGVGNWITWSGNETGYNYTIMSGVGLGLIIDDTTGHSRFGSMAGPNYTLTTSVALEVQSTDGAFLPPRMTTTQRDALTPLAGMLIFNATTGVFNGYTTSWDVFGGMQTTAIDTSAELLAILTDETGTGLILGNNSPTFVDDFNLSATGVLVTGSNGSVTFLGLGDGADEDLKLDLNTTSNTGIVTSSTSLATLNFSSIALQESGIGVLNNDEIDASSELAAIMDDETGSGLLVFGTSPTIATPVLTGKIDRNNVSVDDDDCTGEQGLYWYDTTDSAFEFCNANSGAPAVLGGGGGIGGTTGIIKLYPGGVATDGTGSGNNTAALSQTVSSGTQTSNTPKVTYLTLLADGTTDEHWEFSFLMPHTWASGAVLRGNVKFTSATSGDAIFKGSLVCSVDNSTDMTAAVFEAGDLSAAVTAPGTVGLTAPFTITLTSTSAAADRFCVVAWGRDPNNGSDTITTDSELLALNLEFVR